MSPDEWDIIMFVRDVSVSELWGRVSDRKRAETSEEAGWNTTAIKAAIVDAWNCADRGTANDDYTRISDDLVNNDIAATDTRFSPVRVVWACVKGFDGKIACHAFTEEASGKAGSDGFLFESEKYAESFGNIFGPVWYDTGVDGMAHSIKGFSVKNFHFSTMLNRMKSRMVDSTTFSLGINFTRESEDIPDETPPVENHGAVTVFPSGLKQMAVYPQLQQSMAVIATLEGNQTQNNSLYRDQNQKQIGSTQTAKQAEILAAMQGEMNEASASMYLSQVGRNIFTEVVRRLRIRGSDNRDAKKFVERLKKAGVPEQVIFETEWIVETGASAGMASAAVRMNKAQQLVSMQNLPDMNGRAIRELFVTQIAGANGVKQFMMPAGGQSEPEQLREALQENNDFIQGMQLPAAPSDSHITHIPTHLQSAAQMVQATDQLVAQKQLPNQQAMRAILMNMAHTRQHFIYMEMDETRAQDRKVLWDQYSALDSKVKKFMAIIARAKQQAEQQQQARQTIMTEAARRMQSGAAPQGGKEAMAPGTESPQGEGEAMQ
jgi:hypothetical protein